MKYWEIVSDRLSKAGWSWVVHLRLIRLFGCFSQQMRTASNLKESRMMTVIEIKPHRNGWKFLKHFARRLLEACHRRRPRAGLPARTTCRARRRDRDVNEK